jgi:hypothetical protein
MIAVLKVHGQENVLIMPCVLWTENLSHNLLSVSLIVKDNIVAEFDKKTVLSKKEK